MAIQRTTDDGALRFTDSGIVRILDGFDEDIMAQYTIGTVNVTNGSATVELVSGSAVGNILQGNLFSITDPTLSGAGVLYTVAVDAVDDDEFALSAPWAGTTASGRTYGIHRDFTASGLPLWEPGDVNVPALWNRAMAILEPGGIGGGGGGGDLPSFTGHSGKAATVNLAETAIEYRDHRFFPDSLLELAPTSAASRLFHASMLSGTFSVTDERVAQWNDISGNSRHATADTVGPLPVGAAGRASYGMSFNSSAGANDDKMMIATVPSATNTMFLMVIGRCDLLHAGSRNLLKTAHSGSIDVQTAGDIELSANSGSTGLQLRISTTAATGQLIPLGPLQNGMPFVIALAMSSGVLTGWFQGQFQTAQKIETTYQHGAGFNTDRLRLGTAVDSVRAFTLHEVLLASALPTDANIQRLVLWARQRYFPSQLSTDESAPNFVSPVKFSSQPLIGAHRPVLISDGTNLLEFFPPARAHATPLVAALEWSRAVLRHTGSGTLQITLPATAKRGYELDLEQRPGTLGSISIGLASGAVNENTFGSTIAAGERLRVSVQENSDGVTARYVGYRVDGAGGSGGSGPALATQVEAEAGTENTHYLSPLRGAQAIAALGEPRFSVVTDTGNYSVTPKTLADEHNVKRIFTNANNHIILIPTGLAVGSWRDLVAPVANTLDIRRVNGAAVSINDVAADGLLAGNIGIVPAGGTVRMTVDAANTITLEGDTLGSQTVRYPLVLTSFSETVNAMGNITGSVTVNFALGTIVTATLTGNVTALAFSNMPVGSTVRLIWALASFTLAMPTGARLPDGTAPTVGTGLLDLAITLRTSAPLYDVRVIAKNVAAP